MAPEEVEPAGVDQLLGALQRSQGRLDTLLASLSAEQMRARSYCDEWSIAQVASHLGSGAEIFGRLLEAGRVGDPAPSPEELPALWENWNAKSPEDQVADSRRANAELVERLQGLGDDERARWQLEFFGARRGLADLVRMRLSEQALHSWDILVVLDPLARVEGDAVQLLIDGLADRVAYCGRPIDDELRIQVRTGSPERQFLLELGPTGAELTPGPTAAAGSSGTLRLAAEAFLRLLVGRLDPEHTPPAVQAEGFDLDTVRRAFPGV